MDPAQSTPQSPEQIDEFAAAFNEAVTESSEPASAQTPVTPAPSSTEPAEGAAAPAASADATDSPAVDSLNAPTSPPAAAPAAPATPAAPESPETKIARLEAENAELRRPKVPDTPTPARAEAPTDTAPSEPAAESPKEPEWYKLTDDETSMVKKFADDWPDIARAQEVLIKQASYNVAQHIFDQFAKVYNPILAKFNERAEAIESELAYTQLRGEHQDYDDVREKVVDWVKTLPAAFRAGAEQAFKNGTPAEVAEVIQAYKDSHKPAGAPAASTPATAPAAPATPAPAPKAELSPAARKAAGRLSVVGSQRTTPVAGVDQNDFDGAWKEALGAG